MNNSYLIRHRHRHRRNRRRRRRHLSEFLTRVEFFSVDFDMTYAAYVYKSLLEWMDLLLLLLFILK